MRDPVITSSDYAHWRASTLGATTERIEGDLVWEVAGPLAGRRVLDVGCGDGTYAIGAAARGADVTGIDTSAEMLGAARRRADERGVTLELVRGDATSLPFEDGCFDVVLAVTVLCFIDDAAKAAREWARVLRPGGRLVIGALNRWSVWAARRRLRGWLGSATWRRARFTDAARLRRLVAMAGLRAGRVIGAVYYPPHPIAAAVLGALDTLPRALTTFGAAFLVVAAEKQPGQAQEQRPE